ncbi:MAG: hypothetical protein KDC44_22240 [Phaeodactylibacter sp.]|nr:hypothetical protein [Phaeodactylibacter sp.]
MKQCLSLLLLLGLTLSGSAQDFEIYTVQLDTSIHSEYLQYDKKIQLLTPWCWSPESGNEYPLLVIFDMQNSGNYSYLLHTIDYLAGFAQIPAFMILGIEAGEDRNRLIETSFHLKNSKGEENDRFLYEELFPLLKKEYGFSGDVVLVGHSRYGFYTTYLLTKHAAELMAVISVSPFFIEKNTNLINDTKAKISNAQDLEHDLYYAFAVGDSIFDTPDFYGMRDTLQAMNLSEEAAFHALPYEFPAAWHITMPGLTVNQALYDIFFFWQERQMLFYRTESEEVTDLYGKLQEEIKAHYGSYLDFNLGVLNGTGWRFYGAERYEAAIQCWQILARAYPDYSEAYYYIAMAYKELGNAQQMEAYKQKALTAIPRSAFYTEAEKAATLEELKSLRME